MIRVRFAEPSDQDQLIEFIRQHWSATHVFVDRPDVFTWQYLQPDNGINIVLAEDVGDGGATILGILGFIPTGRFDPSLGPTDLLLAIWKVKDGSPPGLGLRLLKHIDREISPRLIGAIGISEAVKPIYRLLRYEVGTMTHSAVMNPLARRTVIAQGVPEHIVDTAAQSPDPSLELEPFGPQPTAEQRTAVDAIGGAQTPSKSFVYLNERYLSHPWYRYEVRLVRDSGRPVAVIVWRAVEAVGSRVLRIVDIVGDVAWLARAQGHLQQLAIESEAEYIDLVQTGSDEDLLAAGGFLTVGRVPGLVLPNYFSPFEPRNVEVEFAYKLADSSMPIRLYRADSDQDRPNRASDLAPP